MNCKWGLKESDMGEKVVHAHKDGEVEKVEKSRAGLGWAWRPVRGREEDAVDCGVVRWAAATALGNKLVDACHRE